MPLHLHEQERLIRRCADEDGFDIESTIPSYTRHLIALAEQYGIVLAHTQHGVRGTFPKRMIAFRTPVSEARRRRGMERAKKMHSSVEVSTSKDMEHPE